MTYIEAGFAVFLQLETLPIRLGGRVLTDILL